MTLVNSSREVPEHRSYHHFINKVNEDDVNNIAFIKAMLIKKSIEDLDISYKDKIKLKNGTKELVNNLFPL